MFRYLRILPFLVALPLLACSSSDDDCNVSNCHGLEVSCDFVEPPICTEVYELGDKCRVHISCVEEQGSCIAVQSSAYEDCKRCVEGCLAASADSETQFNCESNC